MPIITRRVLLSGLVAMPVTGWGQTPAPENAYLYLITPREGERIAGPFWVRFGLRNMGVTRAGDATPGMGHHHLLVDVTAPLDPAEPIPQDKQHLHFGRGQTETLLELPPGRHTLQLVLGDAEHKPFKPMVASKPIQITVVNPGEAGQRARRARRARPRGRQKPPAVATTSHSRK